MKFPFTLYSMLIFAFGVLVGCSSVVPYTAVIVYPISAAGQTACDANGVPFILLHPMVQADKEERQIILAHERVHVRQIREIGCDKAGALYQHDPMYKMKAEIEAYCAEVPLRLMQGKKREALITRIVELMTTVYQIPLKAEEILKHVTCKGEDDENLDLFVPRSGWLPWEHELGDSRLRYHSGDFRKRINQL